MRNYDLGQRLHHPTLNHDRRKERPQRPRSIRRQIVVVAACWTYIAARAAVFGSAAPADTTHIDQLLSARSSVTRFIAMLATLEQPAVEFLPLPATAKLA